ncbi:cobaltochelatase subunit CobN [Acetobacter orientalis]|uniref:cobaltochelatase subunit CobN n=1 Tax=Acetobacter orientalis TaxID=146474 RepID=UPI0039EB8B24
MHLLVRENRTLDEQDQAEDLGLPPADLVVLSFTESDLLGLSHAYNQRVAANPLAQTPSLQLTHLARLRHPMSIDLYIDTTLQQARCVVVRLLGGLDYWRYGAEELAGWCRANKVPLALLPGECAQTLKTSPTQQADDPRLAELSSVEPEKRKRLIEFFRQGGPRNMACALHLMGTMAGLEVDDGAQPEPVPAWGVYRTFAAQLGPHKGAQSGRAPNPLTPQSIDAAGGSPPQTCGAAYVPCSAVLPKGVTTRAVLLFYRAHLLVSDHTALEALAQSLAAHGCAVDMVFVTSLKEAEVAKGVAAYLAQVQPDCVLNGTVFSSKNQQGYSPLVQSGVPVFQLLQPGSTQALWQQSARGLTRADLAMQTVLPELDGSISTFPLSFRQQATPGHPAARVPYAPGIALTVARIMGWLRLRCLTPAQRKIGLVVSDYPGAGLAQESGHVAHAVGLDTFASLCSIQQILQNDGYKTGPLLPQAALVAALANSPCQPFLSLAQYQQLATGLEPAFMASVQAAWGPSEHDKAVQNGQFCHRVVVQEHLTIAVQPDRGQAADRKALYHDPDSPPCHAYVAFYLWLQHVQKLDALVHVGTHGTLEWLPGKAVALSGACAPTGLVGSMPVIYPFIVNNPGEAATAKRRLGAVTIGHMTPPVMQADLSPDMQELERLIDEYAEADGLDPRRGAFLRQQILERATRTGVLAESGVRPGDEDEAEALARLDAYLCDVKDLQIRDGLHIFGKPAPKTQALVAAIAQACGVKDATGQNTVPHTAQPAHAPGLPWLTEHEITTRVAACAQAESRTLQDALAGRFVPAGPAGAPTRGRVDVLPTGRNLFTIDPRALPTPSAMQLAGKMENLLLTRHIQEEGEPLTHLIMDLWGSASLRTGGEDMALALRLMGVEVTRAPGTGHVQGFEVVPLPVLNRPRVDVTLRISGLFRDAFPDQIALFDQVVAALAARDEAPEWNPLAASVQGLEGEELKRATARIFGAASGNYGTGVEEHLQNGTWQNRQDLGAAWFAGSAWTYGGGRDGQQDVQALGTLLSQATAVLHVQDHAETDMLESPENAAHEGGLAAAAATMGANPARWHGDTSRPQTPHLRSTAQEVARVVRGRLANPRWIEGMQRHGYAGAAELARGLDALHGFAATLPERFDTQFDLVFAATLGNEACNSFLQQANPAAREAMRARFAEAWQRGLWHPHGNSVAHVLDTPTPPAVTTTAKTTAAHAPKSAVQNMALPGAALQAAPLKPEHNP